MRRQVHAVVIVRRRGDRLIQTLNGVRSQGRAPDTINVVDLTGDPTSEEVFREQLGRDASVSILHGRSQMGWSEALNFARTSLPTEGWAWVLREDTTPDPAALNALMATVEGAPSVAIAGPKQRVAAQENWLREFGETITRWGERQAVADRELDQGQYDRMSDVLAVGDAGVLISLSVLDALGGADPALDPLDAPLDLGVRARLAGHRVVAVPQAIVFVERGPADWRAGKNLSAASLFRLDRQAWLYRRFAYAPWWALIGVVLASVPIALARSVAHFLVKRPDFAVTEIVATLGALLRLPQAIVAGARLARTTTVGWAAIRPLRMTPTQLRERRQLQREAGSARAEEDESVRVQPDFWPGGIWLIAGLLALGAFISGPLLGAQALVGGGLAPLAPSLGALWEQIRWLSPDTVGGVWGDAIVPADPASLVLALLGSASWWNPSQAMLWFWVLAPLLAGLSAWWAGAQLVSTRLAANTFAVLWAIQPTLLVALAEGRWHGVVLHIALPWLLATALTAHTSWQRAAQAGFATALVSAMAPLLWPLLILGWLAVLLGYGWRNPVRTFAGTLPLALAPSVAWWLPRLLAPTELALLPGIGRWLADPGVGQASPEVSWWWFALGWPAEPSAVAVLSVTPAWSSVVIAVTGVIVVAAIAGLLVARPEVALSVGVLGAGGLVLASLAPAIGQGYVGLEPVGVWPGSGVALTALGTALAVVALVEAMTPSPHAIGQSATLRRVAAGSLVAVVALGSVFVGLGEMTRSWSAQPVVNALAEPRTLPALVAAEAANHPNQNTLVIEQLDGGEFAVSVEPGAGKTLERSSTLYRLRPELPSRQAGDLAVLAAALVQPSSAELSEAIDTYSIRFVLFRGDPTSAAALAMAQRESFVPAGSTETSLLWQVSDRPASPSAAQPSAAHTRLDMVWWLVWGLTGILALPTERRPRKAAADDDDSRLATVLAEDPDE